MPHCSETTPLTSLAWTTKPTIPLHLDYNDPEPFLSVHQKSWPSRSNWTFPFELKALDYITHSSLLGLLNFLDRVCPQPVMSSATTGTDGGANMAPKVVSDGSSAFLKTECQGHVNSCHNWYNTNNQSYWWCNVITRAQWGRLRSWFPSEHWQFHFIEL